MKILAIDTSTMLGGIAVMDELNLIAETRLNVKSTHSERLMTEIEHCLKQSSLKISDIDVFAVAIGPGSFTGLRIGLSTVKGLSYATGKPIVSVPTLDALALNFLTADILYAQCLMQERKRCMQRCLSGKMIIKLNYPPSPPYQGGAKGGWRLYQTNT